MSLAIKIKDILWILIFYYLYQTVWLITLSALYSAIHEDESEILKDVGMVIHPEFVLVYSIAFYPISIACLLILILMTLFLKRYKFSFIRSFLVSVTLIMLFNIIFLIITNFINPYYHDLFNWILGKSDENTKTGFYGFFVGSIVFMLLYIPLMRSLNNNYKFYTALERKQ